MTVPAQPPASEECPACGTRAVAAVYTAEERMYGMGGTFRYRECAACGTLALTDVPDDLDRYYPPGYYSFAMPQHAASDGTLVRVARRWSTKVALASPAAATAVVASGRRVGREVPAWVGLLAGLGLDFEAAVLDVGCGDGHRLRTLQRHGFTNLTGSDPHLAGPSDGDGMRLLTTPIEELAGPFDVVMFHHSFEHMPEPVNVLSKVHDLLGPSGVLVVRLPLAGSYAWRVYGPLWVQLDAPRHLFLPTVGGFHLLLARAGFCTARTVYDSDGFQFWGSEQYRRGLPLYTEGPATPPVPAFDAGQLEVFERRAGELNTSGDGDQAAFLIRKRAAWLD